MIVENEYKSVIDDITNDRVAFDVQTHGTDQGLLEAMAAGTYKSFKCLPGRLLTDSLIELGSKSLCEMMGEENCKRQAIMRPLSLSSSTNRLDFMFSTRIC